MVKRRLRDAGLPARQLSCHSFRATAITDLLTQGVPLKRCSIEPGHADPRTTRLYDRRQKQVTRNIVERISVGPIGAEYFRSSGSHMWFCARRDQR